MFACNKENQSQATVVADQLFSLLEKKSIKKLKRQVSIKAVDVNARKSLGSRNLYKEATVLHMAARKGSRIAVGVLVEHGADLDAATSSGLTPLMTAARENQPHIIVELLARGASLEAVDCDGNTAMHHAAEWGCVPAATRLFEAGAVIDAANGLGQTPLHLAARSGHRPLARLLLAHGATSAAKDSHGDTCLHYAIRAKDARITKTLLKRGARANIPNGANQTPLELANDACRAAIFKYGDKMNAQSGGGGGARRAWATVGARLSRTTRHFPKAGVAGDTSRPGSRPARPATIAVGQEASRRVLRRPSAIDAWAHAPSVNEHAVAAAAAAAASTTAQLVDMLDNECRTDDGVSDASAAALPVPSTPPTHATGRAGYTRPPTASHMTPLFPLMARSRQGFSAPRRPSTSIYELSAPSAASLGKSSPHGASRPPLVLRSRWESGRAYRWAEEAGPASSHPLNQAISAASIASMEVPDDELSMAVRNEWAHGPAAKRTGSALASAPAPYSADSADTMSDWSAPGQVAMPSDDDEDGDNTTDALAGLRRNDYGDHNHEQGDDDDDVRTTSSATGDYHRVLNQLMRGARVMDVDLSASDVSFADRFNYVHESLSDAASEVASSSASSYSESDVSSVASLASTAESDAEVDFLRALLMSVAL